MNRFLRTAPARQVAAVLAGICAVIAVGATIAVAAGGSGPVPQPLGLAQAIHQGLAAPSVPGVSADITFKNNLIDASELQGADPLLGGGTGRLWAAPDRLRLELQTDGGTQDAQIVVDHNRLWAYDPASNTVYEGTIPSHSDAKGAERSAGAAARSHAERRHAHDGIPSVASIQKALGKLAAHVDISGADPTDVGGQPAYSVQVSPHESGGLLGGVQVAWDALRGVPLSFSVFARGDSTPVLQLTASDVSYGAQDESVFAIAPPAGATVVELGTRSAHAQAHPRRHEHPGRHEHSSASLGHLPFALDAPATLGGLPLRSQRPVSLGRHPGALLVYGQGLGAVAVLESAAPSRAGRGSETAVPSTGGGERQGLTLPTLRVNGATATELDTALGTLVRFTRGGVSYVVAGSVKPAVADSVARGL